MLHREPQPVATAAARPAPGALLAFLRHVRYAPSPEACLPAIEALRADPPLLAGCMRWLVQEQRRQEVRVFAACPDGAYYVGDPASPTTWRPKPHQLEPAAVLAWCVGHPGDELAVELSAAGRFADDSARRALRRAAQALPDSRLAGALATGLQVRLADGRVLASWEPPPDAPRIQFGC